MNMNPMTMEELEQAIETLKAWQADETAMKSMQESFAELSRPSLIMFARTGYGEPESLEHGRRVLNTAFVSAWNGFVLGLVLANIRQGQGDKDVNELERIFKL